MRILGLDPGRTTGYALVDVDMQSSRAKAITYGIIPITRSGRQGLALSICEWFSWAARELGIRDGSVDIAFEADGLTCKRPPARKSVDPRAVILRWCLNNKPVDSYAYTASEVRAILGMEGMKKPKDPARLYVKCALGYLPSGPDHVIDAFLVALAHVITQSSDPSGSISGSLTERFGKYSLAQVESRPLIMSFSESRVRARGAKRIGLRHPCIEDLGRP